METWMREYEKQLRAAIVAYPDLYRITLETLPEFLPRLRESFLPGNSFNKDSIAVKWTCKALGIKHTYKAIAHFIANHQ